MKGHPILFLAVLAVPIAPCAGAGEAPRPTPPPALLDSAWAHIARQVGVTFASRFLTIDQNDPTSIQYFRENPHETRTSRTGEELRTPPAIGPELPVWRFIFRFRDPDRQWIDEPVEVTIDPRGNLTPKFDATGHFLPNSGIEGIGECARDSSLCVFPVNQEDAVRLAKQSGLTEGIRPWTVSFHWYHSQDGRFIWAISNTLSENGPCEASGEAILIDANTGALFNRSRWSRIC